MRMSKLDYFKKRLAGAEAAGLEEKAAYYRMRIEQLEGSEAKVIDVEAIGCREFYSMQDFVRAIGRTMKVMSWGAHAWTKMNDKVLRFKVNAHRHKGHIYVAVNGADLFDVYLTTTKGTIKKEFKDIYLEDFIRIIDEEIEKIEEYVQ